MNTVTRRRFLVASGVTAGAALAAGVTTVGLHELLDAGRHDPVPGDASVLVLVTLYGGNDGLNTVIPAGDPIYQSSRPGLAYAEHEVLPLGEGLGLNPSMTGFKALWDAGRLAIVRGVSYPKPDRSHFRSMAIWQTAAPATAVPTGWLGRWLDATGRNPLHGVAIGATLPPLLAGAHVAGAALPMTGIRVPKQLVKPLVGLAVASTSDTPVQADAAHSFADLRSVDTTFTPILDAAGPDQVPAATPGTGDLGAQLDIVAACIAGGAPTRAYSVSLGGFDTHAGEKTTQSGLLAQVDKAISTFTSKVHGSALGRQVVVAIYSEFGRRVAANANEGTDHGAAGPVFIVGDPVAGGFYGDEPSLAKLNDGDLFATTDFRDVYGTLLRKVLKTDPAQIISGYSPRDIAFL